MAGSIKVFQFIQKSNQIIGISPSQSNEKYFSINSRKKSFLVCSAQIVFSIAAFLVFDAKSMVDYGLAFFFLICIIECAVFYLIFIWQKENTLKFFETCERFIEKRVQSTAEYEKLIGNIELFNQLLWYALFISNSILCLSNAPYTFVRYYIFDMEKESFYLFVPMWLPFDWKTPFGYFVAYLAQYAGTLTVSITYALFFSLFFGSCWLFVSVAEDIRKDLTAFNTTVKTSHGNRAKLMKQFCDLVQLYSDAKQCVEEFNQIFRFSLLIFFLCEILSVSSILVIIQFQLWDDNTNWIEISLAILILFWMFGFIFLICEPGQRVTDQFEMFSDELSQCDWYSLPIEMQRMYMVFLLDTQNPINISSFGGIVCERGTSKKILNKVFSYFMTFRNFRT